eukprot:CAMPEP_0183349822 /NCGR_PEP_ID=MMETSP0164_2-20130417/13884_1 /TAXON_ID=221442 /ORGANISM="Coccolithus pelagicus ssp braarudi, Strain PLY182g" /LENGTH=277 /DNA_ID=CAMNT_0025521611 /DNA_START=51 /DNA_END=884 /DNA_ORIENTATION=-
MRLVALCVIAALVACNAHPQYAEAEYENGQGHSGHFNIHPAVEQPVMHESMPVPSVPEPAVAEAPKKSLVEEVTGLSDANEFRFAEVHEAPAAPTYSGEDAPADDSPAGKMGELEKALDAVKSEIVHKAKSIKSEKQWVQEVTKIIESYVHKTRRVNANIRKLQREVRDLFKKKKQIDNMIIQQRLLKKLAQANKDLAVIGGALNNVQKKQEKFSKSKENIAGTIGAIEAELSKLRGEGPGEEKKAVKEEEQAKEKAEEEVKEAEKVAKKEEAEKKA